MLGEIYSIISERNAHITFEKGVQLSSFRRYIDVDFVRHFHRVASNNFVQRIANDSQAQPQICC